jgi:hypothetical protein
MFTTFFSLSSIFEALLLNAYRVKNEAWILLLGEFGRFLLTMHVAIAFIIPTLLITQATFVLWSVMMGVVMMMMMMMR